VVLTAARFFAKWLCDGRARRFREPFADLS
jgi:hypothetical protein